MIRFRKSGLPHWNEIYLEEFLDDKGRPIAKPMYSLNGILYEDYSQAMYELCKIM